MRRYLRQFNWRFLLVRVLVNAIALAVTAAVVPKVYFVNKSIWNLLFMALTLGVLNALVKPLLQAMTLHFIVATYGLVIVLVNAVLLWLLSLLFPERFAVDSLLWVLIGGLVLGMLSSFLESLLGLTMPIVSDEPPELHQRLEAQAVHMGLSIEGNGLAPSKERPQPPELGALEEPVHGQGRTAAEEKDASGPLVPETGVSTGVEISEVPENAEQEEDRS